MERQRTKERTEAPIRVHVNGKERAVPRGLSVRDLLVRLELHPETVAVEHNREILPREAYGRASVEEGDSIEVVHFVGGG